MLLTNSQDTLEIWREYCSDLYNHQREKDDTILTQDLDSDKLLQENDFNFFITVLSTI